MSKDLELAKSYLNDGATCCVVLDGQATVSHLTGIRPVLEWIKEGKDLSGCAVADKIVGKAAALLFVLAKVGEVYAGVLSQAGKAVLEQANIPCCFGELTERIINRRGDDICPMEKTVSDIDDPKQAYRALSAKVAGALASH